VYRAGSDKANPRASTGMGYIIEITEDRCDHSHLNFKWEIFMLAGKPDDPSTYFAGYDREAVSQIAAPDNISFDSRGNLWIATDGQPAAIKVNDAIHAVAVQGPERDLVKQFLSAPVGAEVSSLYMLPDDSAMFVSIQHPGEGSSLAAPSCTFPDGLARPSIVVVTRNGGGPIGA
jgi:secreted PhoX family phosphatase